MGFHIAERDGQRSTHGIRGRLSLYWFFFISRVPTLLTYPLNFWMATFRVMFGLHVFFIQYGMSPCSKPIHSSN